MQIAWKPRDQTEGLPFAVPAVFVPPVGELGLAKSIPQTGRDGVQVPRQPPSAAIGEEI